MSIVTSTVAACLAIFEVDKAKFTDISGTHSTRSPVSCPDDAELARLVKGECTWSSRGAQDGDQQQHQHLVENLHVHDFVCLESKDGGQVYDIAQVTDLHVENSIMSIKLMEYVRVSKRDREITSTDNIYMLGDIRSIKRLCWVDYAGSTDCDFTTMSPLKVCESCLQLRIEKAQAKKRLHRLQTLSLFGGAGGMDIGLALSHFRTSWMVDSCAVSCQTFAAHHPSAHIVQLMAGEALLRRDSLHTMPRPDQVDAIVMGPPCQPFSKINRQSKEEREQDPRSLCVATGLSYVEVFRPTYGIIENVCGFLENGNLGKVKGNGIIKFVLMCLATLGYKTRMGIVNCSGFGIPQSRTRVAIIFALGDVSLPALPLPTHDTKQSAGLHHAMTIADATSDLPRWDVINPGIFAPSTAKAKEKRRVVPPSFRLSSRGNVEGPEYCRYLSRPQTVFQQQVRLSSADEVADHHTLVPFESPSLSVERFWHIPCRPHANHLSLQGLGQLEIPELLQTADDNVYKNAFRRLDLKGAFPIMMTSICLRGKSGRMIMPDQHRTPSIRELARAQGFPDGIQFHGSPAEKLTQIGNAVPVPLAFALAESIVDAMVKDYLRGERRFAKQR